MFSAPNCAHFSEILEKNDMTPRLDSADAFACANHLTRPVYVITLRMRLARRASP